MVIDRADTGVAFGSNHFDGRGLDPLFVEQAEGLSEDVALEFGASSGVTAFEQIGGFHAEKQSRKVIYGGWRRPANYWR
jgi:hypothetical protein